MGAAAAIKERPRVAVRLTNRWAAFDCDPDDQELLKEHFRYRPPNYRFTYGYRNGGDGYKHLMSRGKVSAGLFVWKRQELERRFALTVRDERVLPLFEEGSIELRPYQEEAVKAMVSASATGGLILSATASGKTRTAAAYFERLTGRGLFVVDELVLLEQTRKAFETVMKERIGCVGRSVFAPEQVTVATIQTLHRHRNRPEFRAWFESLTAVVVDEVHVMMNRRNSDVLSRIKPLAVFGLTATLQMEKPHVQMPAIALAGPVIFVYPIERGVEEGYLSKSVVVRLRFRDRLRGPAPSYVTTERGVTKKIPSDSLAAEYRHRVVLNKDRNDCVEAIVREGVKRGRRAVVLAERKLHIRVLSKRLADIKHRALSGDVKVEERVEAMKEMDAGALPLIIATRVFSKGVDVASVDLIVDATALPGKDGAQQRDGRGRRMSAGKSELIYVDVSDRGNMFERASRSRGRALAESGSPVVTVDWEGDARKVFDEAMKGVK